MTRPVKKIKVSPVAMSLEPWMPYRVPRWEPPRPGSMLASGLPSRVGSRLIYPGRRQRRES